MTFEEFVDWFKETGWFYCLAVAIILFDLYVVFSWAR